MGVSKLRRRDLMGATAAATGLLSSTAKSAAVAPESVYTRVGVRPFINLTAAYTINGGLLTLPEVKAAMDDASRYSVNIDELMEKVGERIASLLGAEAAIVTAGCAAALTHATARHVWLEPIRKDATAAQAAGLKGSGDHAAGLTERICIGTNGFSGR
jgi:hypothetical protein